jgi:hypothetical protein
MISTPLLPMDGEQLARTVGQHIAMEESRHLGRAMKWQIGALYLQGIRRFEFADGVFQFGTTNFDREGKMPLQVPELLSHVNRMAGLLQSMDLWPATSRRGTSMAMVRDSATLQVLLDSSLSEEQVKEVADAYSHLVCLHGTAGIYGGVVDHAKLGLLADVQVVHPMELFSFPGVSIDGTKIKGKIWVRPVPVQQLKDKYGQKVMSNLDKMTVMKRRPIGQADWNSFPPGMYNPGTSGASAGGGTPGSTNFEFLEAKVWELWVDGPGGTCSRYAVGSGRYTLYDTKDALEREAYYCPLGVGRFWNTGGFYGAGLHDALFTLIREYEMMVKTLANNVRDMDRYPILLIQPGVINEKHAFSESGFGLKYLTHKTEPSLLGQGDFRPTLIAPHNSGEVPGRTAAYLEGLIAQRVPIRDILREKGRVDSYTGLQFLEEESQRSNVVPVSNTVRAFSSMYKGLATQMMQKLTTNPDAQVPVKRFDLALAGAVIDFENSTMRFGEPNAFPDVSRVGMSVKEVTPRSMSIRKQEAKDYLDKQQITLERYILLALHERFDPAIFMETEEAAYQTVVMNILSLFNDGETPGKARWGTIHTERPDVQLEILNAFMCGPVLHMASAGVVDAFVKYRTDLLQVAGRMVPAALPDPFEEALSPLDGEGTVPQPSMNGVSP